MDGLELHHIIFRSQASYMVRVPINFICLGPEAHRGDKGTHKNRQRDLELKRELQAKLKIMFCNQYYTLEQIKEILGISEKVARGIVKILPLQKEGYESNKLIFRMLGERFYD